MLPSRCRARRCLAALSLALFWPVAQAAAQPAPSGALLRIDAQVPASYQEPAIAAGPDGFTVAWSEGWWQEPAGGYGQSYVLRVRRFDPAGKPKGPAFRIAQAARYGLGDGTRFGFDVAAGGDGSALVVWSFDAATSPLYGRLLDATGRPRGNAFLLAHRPGFRRPHVVPDRRGGYLVVWSHGTAFVSRRVADTGASPGPRFQTAASSRFAPRSLSALAVGPHGDLAVAWAQRPWDDEEPALFLQRFDSAWRPLSGEIRVESPAGWRSLPWQVSLAFGADGALAILWTAEPAASGERLILARRFTAKGRWAGPPVPIAEGADVATGSAALAADPGGGYLAVWHRRASSAGTPALGFARRLEPSGSLDHVFPLDPEDVGRRAGVPKVVAVGKGRFATVWAGAHGLLGQRFVSDAPGRLELRLRRAVAAEGSGEARLEVVRREGCRGEVAVSYSAIGLEAAPGEDFGDASGKVTFADGDSLPMSIVIPLPDDGLPEPDESFRVVLHDPEGGAALGAAASAEVEIRDDDTPSPILAGAGPEIPVAGVPYPGQGFYLCCADVAPRSAGGFAVAWEEGTLRRPPADYWSSVGFSLFDGDGGWAGDGQAGGGEEEREPRLLPRSDGGFVLLWADEEFRGGATGRSGRVFDAAGEPMGAPFPLVAFAPVGEDTIPLRAAPRPDGGFVAVGLLRSGTSFQLFAERHGGDGRRLGEAIPVTERPILDQDRERQGFGVASDAAGGFVVVWKRTPHPGHPGGVFARRFAPSGAPRGGEIRVGGQVGMVDDPVVAAAPGGAFVVLWNSDRGGHGWTVSARWFDRSGKPLGDEVLVPSGGGGGGGPLAAFGFGGKLLVLWGTAGQLYAGPGLREGSQFTLTDDPFGGAGALAATGAGWTAVYGFVDLAQERAGLLARTLVP